MHTGWPFDESPFHEGERQIQERLGVRERMEQFARLVVRDHMPDEHRDLYEALPYLLIGTLDARNRPWASMLVGNPGFIATPDPYHLDISNVPLKGDPLRENLRLGSHIGLLGIELASRRRNRISGQITDIRDGGFTVRVDQAFGNCPQYIQARDIIANDELGTSTQDAKVTQFSKLDLAARNIIERADTLFIATSYTKGSQSPSYGVDVSHRGGKPGFIRVEDEKTLVFPDFSGNNHFNTIGNILMNPHAGCLITDFEEGHSLYLTASAEIVSEGAVLHAFRGAERLLRLRIEEARLSENNSPLRWRFKDYSPSLLQTGGWAEALATFDLERERNTYVPYDVFRVEPESATVSSFYLRRRDGSTVDPHLPGQFLPIKLKPDDNAEPVTRTYTISNAPNGEYYRLSVKREGKGALVSNFLHDNARSGFEIEAVAPRGKFTLDQSSNRPVVLLSAGVGITPMIAMTEAAADEERQSGRSRVIHFIHGTKNSQNFAFGRYLRGLASSLDGFKLHICFSAPGGGDVLGMTHDSEGHIDAHLLRKLLQLDDYDFYLCGPAPFMQSVFEGLTSLGVAEDRISYESFGPATVLKAASHAGATASEHEDTDREIEVHFKKSDIRAVWRPDQGTILDLAESVGLNPNFSCRSGQCGTCATRLRCGTVEYLEEPIAPYAEDDVLICCAKPDCTQNEDACGENCGIVLDL